MNAARQMIRLLSRAPRGWVAGLLALMLLAGLTEGIGFILLVPMLGVLSSTHTSDNPMVQGLLDLYRAIGLPVSVGGLLVAFLGLIVLRSAIQYARERLGASLQHHLIDHLRQHCYAALLGVEWRWIISKRKSDFAAMLLGEVSRIGVGLYFGLSLLATAATALAYLLAAFSLSWTMTSLALASGGLMLWMLSGHRRMALHLGQQLGSASRDLHANVHESLAGIKLAKILGKETQYVDLFARTADQLREEELRFITSTSLVRALFHVGGAVLLSVYLYLGLSVWSISMPELLALVLLFSRLIPLLMTGQQSYYHVLHAMPAMHEIDTLLAECGSAAEPRAAELESMPVREDIRLDRVTLHYEGRDQAALDNVTLRFPARTTTAIMGPSGAGKSTLADVLMGLLLPDAGSIHVDDVMVAGVQRMAWRRSVAYVPQEVFLFHDSIRANLLWGNPEASEAELRRVLEQAAADFVLQLPHGLDTVVGDSGVRLSGGERQRLALARALLKHPSLLILDEATSALDVENEMRIREAIEHLHGDLTVVIIGHRLPTLEHADQVILLNAGRITAQGTWSSVRNYLGKS